ncbi:MAG: TIGR03936 family radical SAM-associated protein [Clostridiales bacterium]|nr:TIGR03936 family radical SAM-associated protein [Clostridiales bacterium]
MKVRIKFSKEGIMKFIGHLDMMRYFQKAFRRSGIDIAYSKGFSPHQLISFAAPLGVGLTSRGEYMDIFVHSTKDSKTMVELLNKEMSEGVRVLSWHHIKDETKNSNAMSIIAAADYEVSFRDSSVFDVTMQEKFLEFLQQEHILVRKKTKKSEKEVDIRPLIFEANVCDGKIFMKLSTGSTDNLKPEFVIGTFMNTLGQSFNPAMELLICRLEMYAKNEDGQLVSLDMLGEEILCEVVRQEEGQEPL